MNILVACEESQATTKELRKLGHNAFSCDLQKCSGGHPEWHINNDVLPLLNGRCSFITQDGNKHSIEQRWDLIIAHPVCTYLSNAGIRWYNEEKYGDKARQRKRDREEGAAFFMKFINADCDKIAVENPVGYMNSHYRKPDQTIHPWMFGDPFMKKTCFWLKGLEPLKTLIDEEPEMDCYYWTDANGRKHRENKWFRDALKAKTDAERRCLRSKTFPGVAKAMAEQWAC